MVVDFQGEISVGGAEHFACDVHGALADREIAPLFGFGFGDDAVELVFALEDGAHRQLVGRSAGAADRLGRAGA